jgi:glycosyltransferase involved in cell wall biosynthesis
MNILHITPAFYPATYYGGPIFSTYAMCNSLAAFPNVNLRVLCSDMAGPRVSDRVDVTARPMRYPAGYDVYFERRTIGSDIAPGLLPQIFKLGSRADIVWLTGTYSFTTLPTLLLCRLREKPLVWSPRGALQATQEWSGARRPGAKRLFEKLCQWLQPRQCVLHVTAEVEKVASLMRMPGFDAEVISNGVELPLSAVGRTWKPDGLLRLVFISRLDPKKGLENLLEALPLIHAPCILNVYGSGEQGYIASLRALAARLGVSDRVMFHGHVDGAEKQAAFDEADLFVFPTHSENFGMVVAEALAHGIPVIVSKDAPWPALEERGVGLWIDKAPADVAKAVDQLAGQDLATMGARARAWMQSDFAWQSRAEQMLALLESMISGRRISPKKETS